MKISKIPLLKKIARYYLYKTLPEKTVAQGYKFYLQKSGAVSLDLSRRGIFEKTITNYVKSNVKEGQHVIDIGANIGYYSVLFSGLVGSNGKVFAFEPEKSNFEILKKNLLVNNIKNVIAENMAVSDKNGKAKLYMSKIAGQHKIYHPKSDIVKIEDTNTITIDTYLTNNNIEPRKISLVKIDVEGVEFAVVEGMKSILANDAITIILEFSPKLMIEFGKDPSELIKILTQYGFEIFLVDEKNNKISKTHPDLILSEINNIGTPYLICTKS